MRVTRNVAVEYRLERKFHLTGYDRQQTEMVIRLNRASFSEIFAPRVVNNIYLDTWNRGSFHDNLDGRNEDRVKTRIRWYGALTGMVSKPTLELKIRRGLLNTKQLFPLPDFEFDSSHELPTLVRRLIAESELPPAFKVDVQKLEPALINRYRRSYYLSADGTVRATIDSELQFHRVSPDGGLRIGPLNVDGNVLELKYAPEDEAAVHQLTQAFPFRLTRISKYLLGIDQLAKRQGIATSL